MSYVQISGLLFSLMKGEADTEHDRREMMLAVPLLKTKSVHVCFLHGDVRGGI